MTEANASRFHDVLRRFTATMAHSYDVNDVLFELSQHVATILDAAGAGVSVVVDGRLSFVTGTDETVNAIERVQEEHQEGPCMQAYLTAEIVAVGDLDEVDTWPDYTRTAGELGFESAIGLPLAIDDTKVGSLNVYDTRKREWTEEELAAAELLADIATAYLIRDQELAKSRELNDQLQRALDSRIVIEQAKGMLARDHNIRPDDAFELLRRHSRGNNAPIREIANAVVNLNLQLPPDSVSD